MACGFQVPGRSSFPPRELLGQPKQQLFFCRADMAAMFNFHQIEDLLAIVGSWERFHLILGLSYSQAFPPSLILKNRYFCQQGECEKLGDFT